MSKYQTLAQRISVCSRSSSLLLSPQPTLLFVWLSPLPWLPLHLFSKFCSFYSVTVCVPIVFIHFRSITYKLLVATVLCSFFRSPSSLCLADYMPLLPVFCVFGICKPLQFVSVCPVQTPVISTAVSFHPVSLAFLHHICSCADFS